VIGSGSGSTGAAIEEEEEEEAGSGKARVLCLGALDSVVKNRREKRTTGGGIR